MKVDRFLFAVFVSVACSGAVNAENETDRFFARALAKVRPQLEKAFLCFDVAAIKFATQTCESADTIVEAAYGDCHAAEEEYVVATMQALSSVMQADSTVRKAVVDGVTELKKRRRQLLVATVLRARFDSGHCR